MAQAQLRTKAQVKATSKILSGIGINLGTAIEPFFYNALKDKMALGNIKFDSIHENVKVKKKNQEAEFDILMYNGTSQSIIDLKHNAQEKDIELLATKKGSEFRKFFTKYSNHKYYLDIARFSFPSNLQELAREKGIAVLKQKGELAYIEFSKP